MPILRLLLLLVCLSAPAWGQTDPQGRDHAFKLFAAYEQGDASGNYGLFESLFMGDPMLTRRAFVSTVEYATETYQSDMESASEAVDFATELAGLIGQQFGDPQPAAMMSKLHQGDQSVTNDFAVYASALYPGYAALAQPGGNSTYPAASNGPAVYPSGPAGYPSNSRPNTGNGPFRPANATGGPPKDP